MCHVSGLDSACVRLAAANCSEDKRRCNSTHMAIQLQLPWKPHLPGGRGSAG